MRILLVILGILLLLPGACFLSFGVEGINGHGDPTFRSIGILILFVAGALFVGAWLRRRR